MIRSLIAFLPLSIVMLSCQKDKENDDSSSSEIATHSEDQSRFSSEQDAVANDASLMIESTVGF